ncbi:hypothetical protein GCM10011613_26900 [Cellvibrio zantedeschiae]|uniref:Cell division protein n=1 Tax=Cellvibrio zantedeschiae TaxID=1237077 RepID=A0ABQ3B7A2_9GAMM|nr:hypothetical protein [Cellvibrio zantedeschiae]GGY80490.1 hypothetical protein GCM10011613_26900 [Cellvibrio zantedeschiae]
MNKKTFRSWLIYWIYFVSFGHFAVGFLVAWFSNLSTFYAYHHSILERFGDLSAQAYQLQIWWISLFGATVQNLAIFMGVLTYVASKYRISLVWNSMVIGLIVWAPQDILISLQVDMWLHVWVDAIVLAVMLPPLMMLSWLDRNQNVPIKG